MNRHRNIKAVLLAICCVAVVLMASGPVVGRAADPAGERSEIPLWRTGVSTFDGTKYQFPSSEFPGGDSPSSGWPATTGVIQQASGSGATPLVGPQTAWSADDDLLPPPIDLQQLFSELEDYQSAAAAATALGQNDDALDVPLAVQSSDPIEMAIDLAQQDEPASQDAPVVRWYQYPRRWTKGWDSHAEFGIDGSRGNADTLAIQLGLETKRKTDFYTFALDFDYRQASSRSVTNEQNGRLNLDFDRLFQESKWSAFSKLGLEWDQFKAFDLRLNLNGGLGYHWLKTENAVVVTRMGAGASREFGSPDQAWTPEGIFGIEAERQVNKRNKVKGKIDYFPSFLDFGDFRLVSDASWEILLDGSENFSLKLSVNDRYDSTPQGALPNDLYYSLLLLYKF